MYDSNDNLIEHTEYIADTPLSTVGKNDPRMSGVFDWYPISRIRKDNKLSPGLESLEWPTGC